MKATLLATMLSVFLLCTVASAQEEYQIRTDANVNLRATFSLEGDIVEAVPAGTILQVVGMFNRWLKISRNGNELWLADWVSYTRVADGGQTQSRTDTRTQSQIDNCCFVDRQCHGDQEWTNGYWAFQNNQCAAPLQSGLQIPMTSTGIVSSEGNNCCFLNWQCNTDEEWSRGHFAFHIDHCDVPPGLIIEGPENFVARVRATLRFLEQKSPEWFAYAVSGLQKIRLVEGTGISSIRFRTSTWTMSADTVNFDPGERASISMASAMVHEACHMHRVLGGQESSNYTGEKACLEVQIEAAATFDTFGGHVSWLQHILDNIDNPEFQWWHSAIVY